MLTEDPRADDDEVPTLTSILPVAPNATSPVEIETPPDLPRGAEPVWRVMDPLSPCVPATAVFKVSDPLDVPKLRPVRTSMLPPVNEAGVFPATRLIDPPIVVALTPTSRRIAPAAPPVDSPVVMFTEPEEPPDEMPVSRTRPPDVPSVVVPVRKSTSPLTPAGPEFAVRIVMLPLCV